MMLSRPTLILLAASGSALLMIGALLFQHVGGMAPCELCLWQRYPHVAAIVIGVIALAIPGGRGLPVLGALAALSTAGIGFWHTGIERGWWAGPEAARAAAAGLEAIGKRSVEC